MGGLSRRCNVIGSTWRDGRPVLRLRFGRGVIQEEVLEGHLSLRITGDRLCTGYRAPGRSRPCPDDARPTSGDQCGACRGRDAFRPCMTCDGFRCPSRGRLMDRACRRTHHLYLACFGDQTIKVGTASDPRRVQRIVEQGPLAAARIAHAEGPQIKQMETLLSREGFTEAMRRSTKVRLLRGIMGPEEARALVTEAADGVPTLLPHGYLVHLHPPVFVAQPPLAVASRSFAVDLMALAPDTVVEGDVVGAIGTVVFVEDGDGRFALDLGDLRARIVELDPTEPGRKPEVQLGLFRGRS